MKTIILGISLLVMSFGMQAQNTNVAIGIGGTTTASDFYYNTTNNNIGIGTIPTNSEQLTIDSGSSSGILRMKSTNESGYAFFLGAGNSFSLVDYSNYNTVWAVKNGRLGLGTTPSLGWLHIRAVGEDILALQSYNTPASYIFKIDGNGLKLWNNLNSNTPFEVKNNGDFIANGNVGVGTTTMGSHKLAVEGSIGAREVKVEVGSWSDFVFEEAYNLPALEEVEKYILEKGHLENIPSEKQVLENGIYLGDMNAKLLQKIEELTLYTIDQEKQLKAQNTTIDTLATKLLELQLEIEKLKE
ncbi:hypothetical protein [Flavivirga eckloniae]|uniref:Peptidase S74 domain-containing protein n=1 Tax=Flavivirga eckloniae TaxID=1803846 RepID=A0A2K9PSD0_9FLAO|nr:hypothetical protein [Flavivirga eckloniae]AUP79965.1 hypothetical protein C1H87_15145 [Flavivirga eckloniae]